jgi:SnoaL-like protein
MSSINETIANYVAAWNETDADRRRAAIERTWTEDGTYLDGHRDSQGHAAIDAMIAAVQQSFPGYRFRLSSAIEAHHDRVRFSWSAGGTEGAPLFFLITHKSQPISAAGRAWAGCARLPNKDAATWPRDHIAG